MADIIAKNSEVDSLVWAQRIFIMAVNLDLKRFSSQISEEIIQEISSLISSERKMTFSESVHVAGKLRKILNLHRDVEAPVDFKKILKEIAL